jgi:hypothetical protein
MVNPMEIMPILAMAAMIACIPILSGGPFNAEQRSEPGRGSRTHLPHRRR